MYNYTLVITFFFRSTLFSKMRVDQIGLLLWKNYVVRKRQPVIHVACWIRLVRNYIRVKRWVKKTRELGCLGHTGSGIRMAGGGVHDPVHDSRQRGSEILSNLPISCEVDAAERAAPVRSELRMQHWKPVRSLIGIRRSSFLQKRHVSS